MGRVWVWVFLFLTNHWGWRHSALDALSSHIMSHLAVLGFLSMVMDLPSLDLCKFVGGIPVASLWKLKTIVVGNLHLLLGPMQSGCPGTGVWIIGMGTIQGPLCSFSINAKNSLIGQSKEVGQ